MLIFIVVLVIVGLVVGLIARLVPGRDSIGATRSPTMGPARLPSPASALVRYVVVASLGYQDSNLD